MTREEVAKIIESLSEEDQIWIMNIIIRRFWPEFEGKPVGFYDPTQVIDDWEDKELDEFYRKKWDELQTRGHRNS